MPERGNEHLPSGSKSLSRLPGRPGALRTEIAHAALGKSPFAAWARSAVDRQRAAERPDKGVAEQGELVAHGARPPNYGLAASRHVADATCRVHFAGMARVWLHGSAARAVAAALGASSSPKARSRAPSTKRQLRLMTRGSRGEGHHDMIPGLAWMHTHLEGRGGHGTHGGFRERSERYQRQILGGC